MTKKSTARLGRDAVKKDALKNNTVWDELQDIYSNAAQLIYSHTTLAQFCKDPNILKFVDDKAILLDNLHILTRDLNEMNNKLKNIYSIHSNKRGGAKTPDQNIEALKIFEQYNDFMMMHDSVIMPTAYHLNEQIDAAKVKADREVLEEIEKNKPESNIVDVDYTIVPKEQSTITEQ